MPDEPRVETTKEWPLACDLRARSYEMDSFGHVNNAVYLQYLEAARCEYLLQRGVSFADFARWGVAPVLVHASLDYRSPCRCDDLLRFHARAVPHRRTGFGFEYLVTNQTTGATALTARLQFVFTNAQTGRPTRPPEAFLAAFPECREDVKG
ncbi:MAG TPA: thioesterase family protein [Armatimonadota bacterium]|jgi:acyl-CoA thioester hydrolase